MTNLADVESIRHHQQNAHIIARLERLPVTKRLQFMRITIGIATFLMPIPYLQLPLLYPS